MGNATVAAQCQPFGDGSIGDGSIGDGSSKQAEKALKKARASAQILAQRRSLSGLACGIGDAAAAATALLSSHGAQTSTHTVEF